MNFYQLNKYTRHLTMKQFLILISFVFLASGCSNSAETDISETNKSNASNSQTNDPKVSDFSKDELKKMNASDFDAQITIEVMDGKLKGSYVFNVNPKDKKQMLQISVKKGPGYKQDVTKRGTLMALAIAQKNSSYTLSHLEKDFTGMIREGHYPAYKLKKGSLGRITIKNKDSNSSWIKADGKIQTHNDMEITEVGEWLSIRKKKEVRRVKGAYTDQVKFEFYDSKGLLNNETVTVKVTFSTVQRYSPMFSDVE